MAPLKIQIALLTSGGLGFCKPAPGTWGSLPPCIAAGIVYLAGGSISGTAFNTAMIATAVVFTAVCVAFGSTAEKVFGKKDPSQVVADETAGQALPLIALPAAATDTLAEAFWTVTAAFVLFRIFDILKPPPARQLQSIKGGAGIVIDDLIAGVMAAIVLQLGLHFLL